MAVCEQRAVITQKIIPLWSYINSMWVIKRFAVKSCPMSFKKFGQK